MPPPTMLVVLWLVTIGVLFRVGQDAVAYGVLVGAGLATIGHLAWSVVPRRRDRAL